MNSGEMLVSLSSVPAVTTTVLDSTSSQQPTIVVAAPLGGGEQDQVPQQGMDLTPAGGNLQQVVQTTTLGAPPGGEMPVVPMQPGVVVAAAQVVGTPTNDLSASEKKRRRRGWTDEEEKRLREGVAQHGAGQWAKIRDSYGFKSENEGEGRSCVNLKDKWRNLNRPPRPEKPPKMREEKQNRPPRKKKTRTPKRKRVSGEGGDDDHDAVRSESTNPPVWMPNAAAWCRANLTKVEKGKVHVGSLRQKFSQSIEYFPKADVWDGDESEVENLKYDLENPKTEASKKFRSDALEPFVGADAIRQNCFIGGLNQLGVFGWSVKGDEPSPRARPAGATTDASPDLVEVTAEQQAVAQAAQQVVLPTTVEATAPSDLVVPVVDVVQPSALGAPTPEMLPQDSVVPAALGVVPNVVVGEEPPEKRQKKDAPTLAPPDILLHIPDNKDSDVLGFGTVGQVTVPPPSQPATE